MPNNRDYTRRLLGFARIMRHEHTDAEAKMWSLLRSRRLQGFKFRRQHPIAGYIVDFICLSEKLIVELDGGQQSDPEQADYDERRSAHLMDLRMRVLRFSDLEILKEPDAVLERIYIILVPEDPSPQPSPRVLGEGVRQAPTPPSSPSLGTALSPSPGIPGEAG